MAHLGSLCVLFDHDRQLAAGVYRGIDGASEISRCKWIVMVVVLFPANG